MTDGSGKANYLWKMKRQKRVSFGKRPEAIREQGKISEVPCDIPELRLITLHRIGKIKKAVYVRTPQAGAEGIFA